MLWLKASFFSVFWRHLHDSRKHSGWLYYLEYHTSLPASWRAKNPCLAMDLKVTEELLRWRKVRQMLTVAGSWPYRLCLGAKLSTNALSTCSSLNSWSAVLSCEAVNCWHSVNAVWSTYFQLRTAWNDTFCHVGQNRYDQTMFDHVCTNVFQGFNAVFQNSSNSQNWTKLRSREHCLMMFWQSTDTLLWCVDAQTDKQSCHNISRTLPSGASPIRCMVIIDQSRSKFRPKLSDQKPAERQVSNSSH